MADKRSKKIASVRKRLDALLASPVEANPGDEWPTLTQDQVNGFAELVYDIANLAFEPDYKERNVLSIRIVDKKRFTLHDFYEPNDGIDAFDATKVSERDFYQNFSQAVRTASHMISTGQRMLERYSDYASYRASRLDKAAETKSDFDGLRKLLDGEKLEEFRAEADRLMEKYDPPLYAGTGKAAETPYNRNGSYRKMPEELQLLIDDYGIAMQRAGKTADIDAGIAELMPLLDKAAPLVGNDHRTNGGYEGSFDEAISAVREALNTHRYRVGTRALQPAVVRYNRLTNEHRAITTLRERGLQVSLKPVEATA
jgi:hypothetical protein